MGELPIYLDYQASTPVDPRVVDAMLPFLRGAGNASSVQHATGRRASDAVSEARARVAGLVGARAGEIVFTSGATEANNLAILGVAESCSCPGHIITSPTEHPAVLEPLRWLEGRGWEVSYLTPDLDGEVALAELESSIRPNTVLVTLMTANNELGTLHAIPAIGEIARSHGILFHTDAAQACGKIGIDVSRDGIDLLSLSAHKIYGPQGVGVLFIGSRAKGRLAPRVHGGGQEGGLRSGTLNAPGCVGLGAACQIAIAEMDNEQLRIARLRDRLERELRKGAPDLVVNGPPPERRLAGTLHVTFPGVDAEAVMANCPGVAMASGSACSSAAPGPSPVLRAVGMPHELAEASLRLSLGRFTTEAEVDEAAAQILAAIDRVRELTGSSGQPAGIAAA